MPSLEHNCETATIAILSATAGLTTFSIVHRDEDTHADKNRIVVSAAPHENALPGINQGKVKVFRVPVEIDLHYVTRDESAYDALIAAINGAMTTAAGGQIPDEAEAAWVTAFGGLDKAQIEQADDGSAESSDNTRQRVKSYHFLVENTA